MATDTQTAPAPAELTFPSRVLSIPLFSSAIGTLDNTLSTSPYTKGVYRTSQSVAFSAYDRATQIASPVYQDPKFQPVKSYVTTAVTTADGYATKALDKIHAKFPYPFESSPETVYADLKRAPEEARNVAYKTIDQRITTPAYGLAKGVDSRLAPLVDLLESILIKLHAHQATPASPTSSDASTSQSEKAQVTRAKDLVFGAKDHIIVLTTEQAKALRNQNVYIQRAADQAESINATFAASYQNAQAGISVYKGKGVELGKEAQAKVYALSHGVVAELEKIQSTTAQLPAQIQTTLKPLTDEIGSTITEVKGVLTSQEEGLGMSEKATKVGEVIKKRMGPIVEQGKALYAHAIDKFISKRDEAAHATDQMTNGTN